MQFAFARSQADINAVLHVDEKSKDANIAAVRAGNIRDSLLFVPGYTLLLIALTLLIARESDTKRGGCLVQVWCWRSPSRSPIWPRTTASRGSSPRRRRTGCATWIRRVMVASAFAKWTLLGLIGIGLGVVMSLQQRTRRRWLRCCWS